MALTMCEHPTLDELKAQNLPRLNWRDILTITEGKLTLEDENALDECFERFAKPTEGKCLRCGKQLTGDLLYAALGLCTFTWGIAHGEGFCNDCRYPARAYHRDIGPLKFLNVVLQYHPLELHESSDTDGD